MDAQAFTRGSFTLPGEAGYEKLTLELADKWGADVIRDCEGTALSQEIVRAGYEVYATICIIRDHNEWARQHPQMLQQTFLITAPVIAAGETLELPLLERYFDQQFALNDTEEAMPYWQVYDRTTGEEVQRDHWRYDGERGTVRVEKAIPWHRYTASFMAFRMWEEINMYNHTTNNWKTEHLMQLDPRHPQVQAYLISWLEQWCESHPDVHVVRFTSLFYNFVFIWGSSLRNRHLFTDWASYDFTVSPLALVQFEKENGYRLVAEDFINKGKFQVTHMPPTKKKLDYMAFINRFVVSFGKQLVDVVHRYGKKAFVFYDDSWVGMEPYSELFESFGFDGLIKCVFSGYEVRLCAQVPVKTHELRLHPYLFPVGLGGASTFQKGGTPAQDAQVYWLHIRRALLRAPIDRIGLGGYLHLVKAFPDFCNYIEKLAGEFRRIKALHIGGVPNVLPVKVAVLHCWGKLRSWTLSGHFHETDQHDLIHINEALSGLPVEVSFLSFEDIKAGALQGVQVIINAGTGGSAWSGGDAWADPGIMERITQWVYEGGTFLGVNEPSAVMGYDTYFRMADILGVDLDLGARICHGKWTYILESIKGLTDQNVRFQRKTGIYLTNGKARVLSEEQGTPTFTVNSFGQGKGIYLSSFRFSAEAARLLLNLFLYAVDMPMKQLYVTDNPFMECAFYPALRTLMVINNSARAQSTRILTEGETLQFQIEPFDSIIRPL